jgi:hypothetical protein
MPSAGWGSSCQEATMPDTDLDRIITGWLTIWTEATEAKQWDTVVEAEQQLDKLLRPDVLEQDCGN